MMQVEQITEQTINANIAHCLREINDFGSTRIVNICSGKVVEVPWGHMDWFFLAMVTLCGLLLLAVLVGSLISMLGDS